MTTKTEVLVQDFLKEPASTRIKNVLEKLSPELAIAMLATLGQTSNSQLAEDILIPAHTKSSKAARKSLTDPLVDKVFSVSSTNQITGGEEHYIRPNGDEYFARPWGETNHDDIGVLRTAREHDQYILLYGAPGCGKTALAEGAFGHDLFVIVGTGDTEVGDFIGGYVQDKNGGFRWEDGVLIKAMEQGKMLLIDEVGLVDSKVLSTVYSAMDGRREVYIEANPERGTVKAAKGFGIIGATNPNAPGVRLSEALLSRFTIHVEVTTDWELAKKLGVSRDIVKLAANADKKMRNKEMSWAPQFRELLAYRDLSKIFGEPFAQANLLAGCPEIERKNFRSMLLVAATSNSDVPMPASI